MDQLAAWREDAIDLGVERPFCIGAARIDPGAHEAQINGSRERIQPQNLKVLIALVRRKGQVVSRADLARCCWDGRIIGDDVVNHAISVLRSLSERVGGFSIETVPKAGYRLVETRLPRLAAWGRPVGLMAAAGVGLALMRFVDLSQPTQRTIVLQPAAAAPADRAAAKDLAIRLAALQDANAGLIRLLPAEAATKTKADLMLEVSANSDPGRNGRGLALFDGHDRALLWSKNFETHGNLADLRLQMAYTAANVLECALDGRPPSGVSIDQPTLKLYLTACTRLAENFGEGTRQELPILEEVVRRSPNFRSGWAKLLLADISLAGYEQAFGKLGPRYRQHIAGARLVDPDMAEATLLEAWLLPLDRVAETTALVGRAKRQDPDNAAILGYRSSQLQAVGLMRESIAEAKRAVELDPLSPAARGAHVSALAYGGRLDAAKAQLGKFERLWPGTTVVQEMQYKFHLRYGDPHLALAMLRSRDYGTDDQERFLIARADPTQRNIDDMIRLAGRAPKSRLQLGFLIQAMGEFDRTEDLVRLLTGWPDRSDLASLSYLFFRPALKGLRHDPRFMTIAARAGLVSYWQSSGRWPDFCFDANLPYRCRELASRLR